MTKKTRLAVVFGGRSGEHEVSIVSARSVVAAADANRYEIIPMAIDRRGRWADPETAQMILEKSADRTDAVLEFDGRHSLDARLLDSTIDVVFPVLHGPYGEDGTIQGLFEILGLPYVGCDVTSSAACMDKIVCKRLLTQGGFRNAPWCEIDATSWADRSGTLVAKCLQLGLPLFVKPCCLGSSVGISKVSCETELEAAINGALEHDHRVLVEAGITGREIEIAVLGNEKPHAAVPGEIVPGHDFYDYNDKYLDNSCELLAPAPLDEGDCRRLQEYAVGAYRHLGCCGMARVDLFFDGTEVWVNEINTIPGFTAISMYPKLWQLSGLAYPALIDRLIELAIGRAGLKKRKPQRL